MTTCKCFTLLLLLSKAMSEFTLLVLYFQYFDLRLISFSTHYSINIVVFVKPIFMKLYLCIACQCFGAVNFLALKTKKVFKLVPECCSSVPCFCSITIHRPVEIHVAEVLDRLKSQFPCVLLDEKGQTSPTKKNTCDMFARDQCLKHFFVAIRTFNVLFWSAFAVCIIMYNEHCVFEVSYRKV